MDYSATLKLPHNFFQIYTCVQTIHDTSNSVVCIYQNNKNNKLVVRQLKSVSKKIFLKELDETTTCSHLRITPKLLYFDVESRLFVSKYINTCGINKDTNKNILKNIIKNVSVFHKLKEVKPFTGIMQHEPFVFLESKYKYIRSHKKCELMDSLMTSIYNVIVNISYKLSQDLIKYPFLLGNIHGDLHKDNILVTTTGKSFLIDFTDSNEGLIMYDLCKLNNSLQLDTEWMLHVYFNFPSNFYNVYLTMLDHYRCVELLFLATVIYNRWSKFDTLCITNQRINEILQMNTEVDFRAISCFKNPTLIQESVLYATKEFFKRFDSLNVGL